jgi:Caspase domain
MIRPSLGTRSSPGAAIRALIAILTLACLAADPAAAQKRVALVIGNSAYQYTSTLVNPANDARLMAEKLRATGFEVLEYINLGHQGMRRAFATYTSRMESYGRDTVGLIFYAGHGLQVNGQNYIMPVDARIKKESDVEVEALNASTLMRSITLSGNKLNVIILDACRNNPYRATFRSASRGLARMDAPVGSLVAFSTAPGMVAADGTGSNSPYSESLARAITTPGLKIEEMFKRVRNDVFKQTKGSQVPWESSSIFNDFYFAPTVAAPKPSAAPGTSPAGNAGQVWVTIQATTSTAVLKAFISQFPTSVYATFAKARLNELQLKTGSLSVASSKPVGTAITRKQAPVRDNRLRAVMVAGGKPLTKNVRWDIYHAKKNIDGKRAHVTYSNEAAARFKLKDGRYYVTVAHGNAYASGEITVRSDKFWGRHFDLNAGRLILTSAFTKNGAALKSNVRWDVYHAELDEDDRRKHITYATSWRAKFVLPAGRYYVVSKHGNAWATQEIAVTAGTVQKLAFNLNAGRLIVTSALAKNAPPLKKHVRWDVYHAEKDEDDRRKHITYATSWRAKFVLPAGDYHVVSKHGNAWATQEIAVTAGTVQKLAFNLNAGRLIVTSALAKNAPPLKKHVRWDVYHAEKDEDDKRKHITYATSWRAKFVLPAGRYYITARHGASASAQELVVEPGKAHTHNIELNAGRIKLLGRSKDGAQLSKGVRWDIYTAKADFEGKRRHITYATEPQPILTLSAGTYRVVLSHGKTRTVKELTVTAGDIKRVDLTAK